MAQPAGDRPITTGLVPPRIDQAPRPEPQRILSPGTPSVVRAKLVIISGTAGSGLFVYSPDPGAGNLVASLAAAAGTDQFGNVYPAGFAVYDDSGDIVNINSGEILLESTAGLLREIAPEADLIYSPAAAAGTLTTALASQAGVDSFGNAFLQGLTSSTGQLTGQVIAASTFQGQNLVINAAGLFIYEPPAQPVIAVQTAAATPSVPYFIGHNAVAGGAGTTMVISVTNGTTAGDEIHVSADAANGGPQVSQITDARGNVYTKASSSTSGIPVSNWTSPGPNALQPGDTITLTYATSAGAKNATVAGIPGLPANPIDNIPTPTSGTSTSPSITTGTLAQANEVVLATLASGNAGGAPSWAAGWNLIDTNHRGASSDQYISCAYQIVSSTAPVTASATITSAIWGMCAVTFKAGTAVSSTALVPVPAAPVIIAPPIPYVIGGNTAAAGGSSLVITLGAGVSTTAGDVIHVCGCGDGSDLPTLVTDSKSNLYALAESANSAPDPFFSTWHSGQAGTPTTALGPGDTITLTYSGTTGTKAAAAVGIPNLPAFSFDLAGSSNAGGTSNNPSYQVFGQAEATEIVIVDLMALNAAGASVTWTDGLSQQIDQRHATAGIYLTTAWQATSVLPQTTIAATLGASTNWTMSNENYKEV
jgi:hypothetical protein